MAINWLDVVLLTLFIIIMLIETKRGFGKAFFDFAAFVVALKAVHLLHGPVASSLRFAEDANTNEAVLYAGLFLLVGGACWFGGKQLYDHTLLTLESFDPVLGTVLGIGVAIVVGHAFTNTLAIISTINGQLPAVLTSSTLGMEFHDFKSYHAFVSTITRLPA